MMAMQEHSLYDDSPSYTKPSDSMYLNLKPEKRHNILCSPDASVFALSTPEVQNILSTSGNATTISTATKRTPTTPNSTYNLLRGDHQVTFEQEYYAKGFLDRLEALQASDINHRINKNVRSQPIVSSNIVSHTTSNHFNGSNPSLEAVAPTYVTASLNHIPNFASATQTISETTSSYPMSTSHNSYYTQDSYSMPFRHESAVLPGVYSMPGTMTLAQPIMYGITDTTHLNGNVMKEMTMVPPEIHVQEQMKVERKKARNRIAASKCREKRLQRESDLQTKVKILKEHNKELNDEVNGLREQISNLKRALLQHMKTGCQVNIPEHFQSNHNSSESS